MNISQCSRVRGQQIYVLSEAHHYSNKWIRSFKNKAFLSLHFTFYKYVSLQNRFEQYKNIMLIFSHISILLITILKRISLFCFVLFVCLFVGFLGVLFCCCCCFCLGFFNMRYACSIGLTVLTQKFSVR